MSEKADRILGHLEHAARDNFATIHLSTSTMTPELAGKVLRRIPAADKFDPASIADHLAKLPPSTGETIRFKRSANRSILTVSIPGDRKAAFAWVDELIARLSASAVKMNLGPDKTTDVKVFWGQPDINTLIEIGGVD